MEGVFCNCFSWNCASSFPVIVCHTIHYWSVLHDGISYETYSMVDVLVAIFLILALHVDLALFFLILSIRPLASRIHIQPSWGGYPCPHHIHIQPPWGGYPCPHHALPIMFGLNCTLCMAAIPGRDELHVSGLLCPAPSAPPCLPCAVRNYICTLLGLWTLSILENDE